MLLALDIGNSNISLGVFRGAELRMRAKISVQTRRSADEYAAILYDLLRMRQISREEIGGCILSSVVPELTGLVEEAARTVTGTVPVRVGPGIRTGFPIRIDDPSQLGGDLVADTLAALTEYGAPLVLVDAGTVTTIAAVDGGRAYLGGCIVPGIRQGAAVLKDTAALLPSIELGSCEESCLGRSSADAIRCGLLLSSAMTVDGFLDRYSALPGMAGAKCVATGGSAELVTALCRRPVLVDPELTLKGLRYLYEANRPKTRRS
ncbi:MAG: type III pantothenate kinase [Oscillospiraceae bacterium]|jgi:type III pantothenate kinase|nr:type III pantothenate kinase [Oscillospiraceae bacterium]MCI9318038.1 type III pantothenate kinase [Oscillospiraceae bacterium]